MKGFRKCRSVDGGGDTVLNCSHSESTCRLLGFMSEFRDLLAISQRSHNSLVDKEGGRERIRIYSNNSASRRKYQISGLFLVTKIC